MNGPPPTENCHDLRRLRSALLPKSVSAISMVLLLCAMSMNCCGKTFSLTKLLKRSTFTSSKGAATSSRGKWRRLLRNIANMRAVAVRAFFRRTRGLCFGVSSRRRAPLCQRRTRVCRPSPVIRKFRPAAGENFRNVSVNLALTSSNVF